MEWGNTIKTGQARSGRAGPGLTYMHKTKEDSGKSCSGRDALKEERTGKTMNTSIDNTQTHKHTNTSREQEDPLTFSAVHVCPLTDHNWTPTDHNWMPTDHNRTPTDHNRTPTDHNWIPTDHIGHYPAMTGCPLTITEQTTQTHQAMFPDRSHLSILFPPPLPDMLNKPS